jgi:predicted MPP superfamily phosphohydrolase
MVPLADTVRASPLKPERKTPRIVKWVAFGFGILLVLLAVWSLLIEPNQLKVNETPLPLPSLDAQFGPLRVALISDLHVGSPFTSVEKVRKVVSTVNGAKPDIILIAGDFVTEEVIGSNFVEPEPIAAELKNLKSPLGTYAVLGNHDWSYDGPRITRALTAVGITVLENSAARIERGGRHFWLLGIADLWTRHPDFNLALSNVPDDAPVIALTHNPDIFPKTPTNVILTLAGHTHGGQVNLPLVGRLQVPSRYGQRYAAGHIREAGHDLYVTTGIGTSILPIRFRVPPEISILNL